jgi:hypothetical protein
MAAFSRRIAIEADHIMKSVIKRDAARGPRAAACGLLALWFLGLAGCERKQSSGVPLAQAAGKVTLDGKPLAEATLEFVPTGDTKGQGGSAITDDEGLFTVTSPFGEEGLTAGDYRVVISKLVLPAGVHFDVPPDKTLPPADNPYQESLPAKYSDRTNSKLNIKVSPGGSDKLSFTLKSSSR